MAERSFKGYVTVTEAAPGMIALRADLGAAKVKTAVKKALGVAMPAPLKISGGDIALAWMSPDEALVILPRDAVAETLAALSQALAGQHHLVADVSDARAVFDLDGPLWAEILAKLSPADVADLAPGDIRRSRLAQVAAAFWPTQTGARVVAFRSVGDYVFGLLANAATPGSEVG